MSIKYADGLTDSEKAMIELEPGTPVHDQWAWALQSVQRTMQPTRILYNVIAAISQIDDETLYRDDYHRLIRRLMPNFRPVYSGWRWVARACTTDDKRPTGMHYVYQKIIDDKHYRVATDGHRLHEASLTITSLIDKHSADAIEEGFFCPQTKGRVADVVVEETRMRFPDWKKVLPSRKDYENARGKWISLSKCPFRISDSTIYVQINDAWYNFAYILDAFNSMDGAVTYFVDRTRPLRVCVEAEFGNAYVMPVRF